MDFLRVVCFLAASLTVIEASCMHAETREIVTMYGTRVSFCEYEGLRLLPKSKFTDFDKCVTVTCHEDVMSICGYGINAGIFAPISGCHVVSDGCEPRFVNLRNPDIPC